MFHRALSFLVLCCCSGSLYAGVVACTLTHPSDPWYYGLGDGDCSVACGVPSYTSYYYPYGRSGTSDRRCVLNTSSCPSGTVERAGPTGRECVTECTPPSVAPVGALATTPCIQATNCDDGSIAPPGTCCPGQTMGPEGCTGEQNCPAGKYRILGACVCPVDRVDVAGSCVCAPPTVDQGGQCVAPCPSPRVRDALGNCKDPACSYPDQTYDPVTGECVFDECPVGQTRVLEPGSLTMPCRDICPNPASHFDPVTQRCVWDPCPIVGDSRDVVTGECGGRCTHPEQYWDDVAKMCKWKDCPVAGTSRDMATGKCGVSCPYGFEDKDGVCVPVCAVAGTERVGDQCVPRCQTGEERVEGQCVAPCVAGEERIEGQCEAACPAGQAREEAGDCAIDKDGDGKPDSEDLDDDGDGILDRDDFDHPDHDGDRDGIPDRADGDCDGDGIPNNADMDNKKCLPTAPGVDPDTAHPEEEVDDPAEPLDFSDAGVFQGVAAAEEVIRGFKRGDAEMTKIEQMGAGAVAHLPQSSSCVSLEGSFMGATLRFPGDRGCVFLGRVKEVFGWVLYALTALNIFGLVLEPWSK